MCLQNCSHCWREESDHESAHDDWRGTDPYNDADYDDGNLLPDKQSNVDVLVALMKELEKMDAMTAPSLASALADLPVSQEGPVAGISVADAMNRPMTCV